MIKLIFELCTPFNYLITLVLKLLFILLESGYLKLNLLRTFEGIYMGINLNTNKLR